MTALTTTTYTEIEGAQPVSAAVTPRRRGRPPVMPLPTSTQTNPTGWPSEFWADAWDDFKITNAGQAAGYTRDQLAIIRHLAWWLEAKHEITDPGLVKRRHLQEYLNEQEQHRTGSGILCVYKVLKVWWRHYAGAFNGCEFCLDREAYRSHSCDKTPVHGVRKPKPSLHKSKTVPVLDDNEWAKVLAAAGDGKSLKSARDRALLTLMGESGLRRAEAQQLNLSDVDLEAGTVLVRHGKNDKQRVSVFGDDTRKALNAYLRMRKPAGATLKTWIASNAEAPLWISTRGGQRLSYMEVGKIMSRLGDAAGISGGFHAHQTRHMAADRAYRDGLPPKAMMTLFGWSGRIPATYGADAEQERAVALGQAWLKNRKNGR